jgi:hypothetical protein
MPIKNEFGEKNFMLSALRERFWDMKKIESDIEFGTRKSELYCSGSMFILMKPRRASSRNQKATNKLNPRKKPYLLALFSKQKVNQPWHRNMLTHC